jgi:hypothetical protein
LLWWNSFCIHLYKSGIYALCIFLSSLFIMSIESTMYNKLVTNIARFSINKRQPNVTVAMVKVSWLRSTKTRLYLNTSLPTKLWIMQHIFSPDYVFNLHKGKYINVCSLSWCLPFKILITRHMYCNKYDKFNIGNIVNIIIIKVIICKRSKRYFMCMANEYVFGNCNKIPKTNIFFLKK